MSDTLITEPSPEQLALTHVAPSNWHTLCGIDASTHGLRAYDLCSIDDSPVWCPVCMFHVNNPDAPLPYAPERG